MVRCLATVAFALAALAPAAWAEVRFDVGTAEDTVDAAPGDGRCRDAEGACSLRAAFMETNALRATPFGADIEVHLPAGLYLLTRAGTGEDAGADGDLDLAGAGAFTLAGAGTLATVVDGGGLDRVLDLQATGGVARIRDLTIRGGAAGAEGGGAIRVTGGGVVRLLRASVRDNATDGGTGGGILLEAGDLRIVGGEIRDNRALGADARGGGAAVGLAGDLTLAAVRVAGNEAPRGGGLFVLRDSTAQVWVGESLFELNVADAGGAAGSELSARGGAIDASGGALAVFDTTFRSNRVPDLAALGGGAVYVANDAFAMTASAVYDNVAQNLAGGLFLAATSAVLTNATVTRNLARGTGGLGNAGGVLHVNGTAVLLNATIANNEASDGVSNEIAADFDALLSRFLILRNTIVARSPSKGTACAGFVFSDGGNVVNDGACFQDGPLASDLVDVDPLLDLLADDGGTTRVRPLLEGSPAVDGADPDRACPWRDQRGWLRAGPCDSGAYERGAVPISPGRGVLADVVAGSAAAPRDVGYAVVRLAREAGLL